MAKINTWNDRDAQRINNAVRAVESRISNAKLGTHRYINNESSLVAARRIRGDTTGIINPGATGTITGLKGVDGLAYETSPLTVRNKITGFAIPNATTVLAQYVHEDKEWQVIEIAGQGSEMTDQRAYASLIASDLGPFTSPGSNQIILAAGQVANMTVSSGRITAQIEGVYQIHFHCSVAPQTGTQPSGTPLNLIFFEIRMNSSPILSTPQVIRSFAFGEPIPWENVSMSLIRTMAPTNFVEVFCGGTTSGSGSSFALNQAYFAAARVSTNVV